LVKEGGKGGREEGDEDLESLAILRKKRSLSGEDNQKEKLTQGVIADNKGRRGPIGEGGEAFSRMPRDGE